MAKAPTKLDDDIVIEPDAPKPETEVVVAPQEDAPPVGAEPPKEVLPEEGIETLKAKLAESERRRLAEAAGRRQAEARAAGAGKETIDAQIGMVANAMEMLKQSSDVLEANLAQAYADGDFAAAAKINREMAENASKLQVMEAGKKSLEEQAKAPVAEPVVDRVEALAAQLSPRSAGWVRAHPEFARDDRLYTKMIAAHNLAIADGVEPDSDAYFSTIEGTLGLRGAAPAAVEANLSAAAKPAERVVAPPAAPPGRGGNGATRTVRLSADEREMATMMGLTETEYAANKLALIDEGKLN